ncbi:MAG: hypothetical protein ACPL1A_09920 [Candidatus Kapaibacteriota bacterium]
MNQVYCFATLAMTGWECVLARRRSRLSNPKNARDCFATLAMTARTVSLRGDEVDEAIPRGARDCFVPTSRDSQ